MEAINNEQPQRDQRLWAIAEKRAEFKNDLVIFLCVNAFFWLIWLLSDGSQNNDLPWPVWATAGWGILILFQFVDAYLPAIEDSAEREYEILKGKNKFNNK